MLTITVLTNELLNIRDFSYEETIPYSSLIFLVHLWAFMSNKPRIVAFSLWLIIVGIITQIGFCFAGWAALKTGHWVGLIFGLALVIYLLVKSSILKGREDKTS
jgi:CHASE2 domain-containing sensor protein